MKMKETQGLYNPANGIRPEDWFTHAVTQRQKLKARMQSAPQKPEFNPNKHEAWSISLSQLVNLWQAKYDDTWVDVSDLDDDFWPEASARLHMNNKMETYDRENTPWARLKEDA